MKNKEQSNKIYEPPEPFYRIDDLRDHLNKLEDKQWWIFRAQPACLPLKTTLERCCVKWGFQTEAHKIEEIMIREFRRVYEGEDRQNVEGDTLYCLSLLRHYGAPVRLLDFTYSKYIALYFGLEEAYKMGREMCYPEARDSHSSFTLWCINTKELNLRVKNNYQFSVDFLKHHKARVDVATRDDTSFKPLYLENRYKLVIPESPVIINRRQHLQQSVFLCPGNVKLSFMDNLLHLSANVPKGEIQKLTCELNQWELEKSFEEFRRMNITRESLFPGLAGLAESMQYQAGFYRHLYNRIEQGKLR